METPNRRDCRETYVNPVYPDSFPDPFVLKYRGTYFGYCTGFGPDGRVFGIVRSDDLVTWHRESSAMEPIAEAPPFYWAPEVTYDNGKFYLYYSAGNETLMHLRVAVSDRPDGGFVDSGRVLTSEDFAIDPHVFIDADGSRYLFYATDFLTHTHIGTGTVVDKLIDWFELRGEPRPVTRARYDWQVYDPQRLEKGGVRWHTVEGPSVLKRKGRYFEMFSGGNWQNTSYGVSYALSDEIAGTSEWRQHADGENVLPILRTIPEKVVGPGHNSYVRGPNNRETFCVYHAWHNGERVMAIDRMEFAGERLFVIGPTYTPQIKPYRPFVDSLRRGRTTSGETLGAGQWTPTDNGLISSVRNSCELTYPIAVGFLCEFTVRCVEWKNEKSRYGFRLAGASGVILEFSLFPGTRDGSLIAKCGGARTTDKFYLPLDFILTADHLIRLDCDDGRIKLTIDASSLSFRTRCDAAITSFSLYSEKNAAEFSALAITKGFELLFETDRDITETGGWETGGSHSPLPAARHGELLIASESEAHLTKRQYFGEAEFAANIRLQTSPDAEYEFGIELLDESDKSVARFGIRHDGAYLTVLGRPPQKIVVSGSFIPEHYHQFRLIYCGGLLTAGIDESNVIEVGCALPASRMSIFCRRSSVAIEMARATAI